MTTTDTSRPTPCGAGPAAPSPLVLFTTLVIAVLSALPHAQTPAPLRGLSHAGALSSAYRAVLNADFDQVAPRLATACVSVPAWCAVMDAVSHWWQIALDPDDRSLDPEFLRRIEAAISASEQWTTHEPQRAEAWFARGAAYGARAQWRVLRRERLAAARDGKQIRETLERSLALDPEMHDARFGVGMYRYYADVAPAALRMLRWLLLLPGGDRKAGLQEMQQARDLGIVIRGEADYQLHLIYLWYERRPHDALALIRGLQEEYPRNPLFALVEARIHDVYFHDAARSEVVLRALIARAEASHVNETALATRRARLAIDALRARTRR